MERTPRTVQKLINNDHFKSNKSDLSIKQYKLVKERLQTLRKRIVLYEDETCARIGDRLRNVNRLHDVNRLRNVNRLHGVNRYLILEKNLICFYHGRLTNPVLAESVMREAADIMILRSFNSFF